MLLLKYSGSGSVPDDGPGTLNYAWSWSPGDIQEGTYNPRLTVYDYSGFQVSDTPIGIDRTPPTMTAPTIGNGKLAKPRRSDDLKYHVIRRRWFRKWHC